MTGPSSRKNLLTFGSDPVLDTDSGSHFNFPHHCGIGDFISISHSHHQPIFTILGEMTETDDDDDDDADKRIGLNPHFGSE